MIEPALFALEKIVLIQNVLEVCIWYLCRCLAVIFEDVRFF